MSFLLVPASPRAATSAQPATSTGGSSSTANNGPQINYLQLIVAQMKNLNPMDPSSGQDSMPMMMQAEELNQLTTLNAVIAQVEQDQQASYAASLIGRTVSGTDANGQSVSSVVTGMQVSTSGVILQLKSGGLLPVGNVSLVGTASTPAG